ncbi:peptidase M14 [Nocardioides dongxiaopingii]|nr:peptidase M14 [Nocardioides sp. S-1144]
MLSPTTGVPLKRTLATLSCSALLASALALPATDAGAAVPFAGRTATAAAPDPDSAGRGAATATRVAPLEKAEVARRAAAAPVSGDPLEMPTSYPYQPELRLYRDNPDDAAHTAELLGHPDLAPQLLDWMAESDRISTQVVGQSTAGRDLYLVTVTAPERAEDTAQQTAWKEELKDDPEAASDNAELLAQYKTPVWVSANIHGNEWEGTDGVMQYIDWLVHAPTSEVGSILRNNRLYFSLSLNPDGRTLATRATALGLDPNRDMITNTTPETRSFVRTAQAIQPLYSADLHGYTNVLQVEPCGPPHGSNYEYDLYMPHNYAIALDVEADVVAANIPGNTYYNIATGQTSPTNTGPETAHIKIPYRDTASGWDDFPPIFTAQYAAFYGAATATVELPLTRGASGGRQTPARAVVNTAVAVQTVKSMVEYMNVPTNAREMLLNQAEVFRRGASGEAKVSMSTENIADVPGPTQWKPLWDVADDQEPVSLPRAYVIPVGDDQRSASDASSLVEKLLFHDIEVGTLDAAATVGGTTYPAGSYVVDMHQPLRGLANSLLDLGDDISDKVPSMYDISAWSYSYLWGATVDKVGATTDAALGAVTPVTAPTSVASMPADGYLTFEAAGLADMQAVNALLDEDVAVSMLADGSVVVAPGDRDAVAEVADGFDIAVEKATPADVAALDDESTKALSDLTIAYAGTQDDRLSLGELGFDELVSVTAAGINTAATSGTATGLEDADVLWIGSTFNLTAGSPGRLAVQAFVDGGGSVLGRGSAAFNAAAAYGLVTGTAVTGNSGGNGIVAVDTPADSLLAPYAQDTSFIYPATWFTGLGAGTEVEQTYGADPLLAGHWRASGAGVNGPDNAANQPSVVSGEVASGARSVVFGTSVLFRTHPKGGLSQAARALLWAGPEGLGVPGPEATTISLEATTPVVYPAKVAFDVEAATASGPAAGSVAILDAAGRTVGSADLAAGSATVSAAVLPGTTSYTAVLTPASAAVEPATSSPVTVTVAKASSTTSLKARKVGPRKVRLTVGLVVRGLRPVGPVTITDGGRKIKVVSFGGSATTRTFVVRLPRGRHSLRAVFAGTAVAAASKSAPVVVRITR